jgi:anaerobic selenocysteine-containing dehydrogenase
LEIGLRERHPDPFVTIHPELPGKLGIQVGDWETIETVRGKIRQKAKLTDRIRPDVVNTEAHWWFPENRENFFHSSEPLNQTRTC